MKVCAEPGCPKLTHTTRCADCTRGRERARGTRQQRGYDAGYDTERRRYVSYMINGVVLTCWRCGATIDANWFDLGHCDNDRSTIHGPLCPPCNRGSRGACQHPSHTPGGGANAPLEQDRG